MEAEIKFIFFEIVCTVLIRPRCATLISSPCSCLVRSHCEGPGEDGLHFRTVHWLHSSQHVQYDHRSVMCFLSSLALRDFTHPDKPLFACRRRHIHVLVPADGQHRRFSCHLLSQCSCHTGSCSHWCPALNRLTHALSALGHIFMLSKQTKETKLGFFSSFFSSFFPYNNYILKLGHTADTYVASVSGSLSWWWCLYRSHYSVEILKNG